MQTPRQDLLAPSSIALLFKLLFQASSFLFLIHFFYERIAKYDSCNNIQIPGYLVDLFRLYGRPCKNFRLGLIGYKMLLKYDHNKITIILSRCYHC